MREKATKHKKIKMKIKHRNKNKAFKSIKTIVKQRQLKTQKKWLRQQDVKR